MTTCRVTAAALLVALVLAFDVALFRAEQDPRDRSALSLADASQTLVPAPPTSPRELSGLTHASANLFYAVSDGRQTVHPLSIAIDPATGRVVSIEARPVLSLFDQAGRPSTRSDLEGIAFDAASGEIVIVDESGAGDPRGSILAYRVADGQQVRAIDLTESLFSAATVRGGFGLESLALSGSRIWTANEEALNADGPRATSVRGTTVRLTRFEDGRLSGQWAYVTEPASGSLPYVGTSVCGVVDLIALSESRVLVLERATVASQGPGDIGGFVSRIFDVDVTDATDITGVLSLSSLPVRPATTAPAEVGASDSAAVRDYRPVRKRLLWSRVFSLAGGPNNFEGMALGPLLADGSRSVLLVADNDILPSNFWALRLTGP